MREILFKAKHSLLSRKWYTGYILNEPDGIYLRDINKGIMVYIEDPIMICQYTGLTDKNGSKIWENDVIKHPSDEKYAQIKFGTYRNCFNSRTTCHVGFYVDWRDDECLRKDLGYWINLVNAEIVGNVFDNPKLLKGIRKDEP